MTEPRTLSRKATWIDKTISLRSVLKDPRALKAFQDFSASVHAEENISLYVAVEFFKVQHVSTPKTSAKVRKRLSMNIRGLQVNEDEGPLFVGEGRHSIMMDKFWTSEKLDSLELTEAQKSLLRDALKIFTVFIEDGAPHWACIDKKIVDDIRTTLKSGEAVDIGLFNKAQAQIYGTMQSDTFPRFIKAIIANPEKYSSGEKFELPEDLIQALKAVASSHELLGKDVGEEDAAAMLVSPRMQSRRMEAVREE